MNTRRQAFTLAAALTATVFTAAAAFAGVSHRPTASTPASTQAPTAVVRVAHQLAPTPRWADD